MKFRSSIRDKSTRLALAVSIFFFGGIFAGSVSANPALLGANNTADVAKEAVMTEDGFLWHPFETSASRTYSGDGSDLYAFNPNGEDIVVTRTATGTYTVVFSSTNINFSPKVTAYGTTAGEHCNIRSFGYPGTAVNIRCWDSSGNLADEKFTLRWTTTFEDAYAWVSASGITVSAQNNPWGAGITATKTATGRYTVTTPGSPGFEGGHIQVSAYAPGSTRYCKVRGWGSTTANIACYDTTGTLADSNFTFLRVGSNDDAYVWANNSTSTAEYPTNTFYSHNPQITPTTSQKISTGYYKVGFPDLLRSYGGSFHVTAYGTDSTRCVVRNFGNPYSYVRCFNGSGALADAKFNALYTRFQTCHGEPANIEVGNNMATPGDDIIVGTSGDDTISGLGGHDTICGMNGSDTIYGGPGNDNIYGGDGLGNDNTFNNLYGGSGNDNVRGGPYDDNLYGQGGVDYLQSNNTLSGFADVMSGGSANDVLRSYSVDGSDMRGNGNNDILYGSGAADFMRGDPGLDLMYGFSGDDIIEGGNGADRIYGGNDNDTISGHGSPDRLYGGSGNDTIYGGNANDIIDGGPNTDYCNGQGQTGGAGDTSINCETAVGFPRPANNPLNFRPGRQQLSEVEIQAIDRCDSTLEDCLSR